LVITIKWKNVLSYIEIHVMLDACHAHQCSKCDSMGKI